MSKYPKLLLIAALAFGGSPALAQKMGLGRAALPEEVAAWDKDVRPDGLGLPEGSGDVLTGEEVFSDKCAACHGEFAEGVDNWPKLAGGKGTLNREDPLKTVGSYWPHLSTVWDYVNRSMPFGNAQSLTADEVYAITAYILYSNDLVEDDFVLSNENFASFELPNAGGFFVDDRDQTELAAFGAAPCMENCKPEVKITMHATVLDVTPGDPTDDAPAAEVVEVTAEAPEAAPEVVAEAAPALDPELVAAGEKVFKKCAACHKVGDKAKNGSGPMLNGIVGRAAGSVDGFRYSSALMDAAAGGLVWDADALHVFLEKPKSFLPKTKMSFAGLKKAEDRDAIIAYLSTFGG
ncbi:MAG: c-type cytochrome [Pseudorhodobacter sp.]|nr:c-type cytochrome [Pseudorhodobacter sp.]